MRDAAVRELVAVVERHALERRGTPSERTWRVRLSEIYLHISDTLWER